MEQKIWKEGWNSIIQPCCGRHSPYHEETSEACKTRTTACVYVFHISSLFVGLPPLFLYNFLLHAVVQSHSAPNTNVSLEFIFTWASYPVLHTGIMEQWCHVRVQILGLSASIALKLSYLKHLLGAWLYMNSLWFDFSPSKTHGCESDWLLSTLPYLLILPREAGLAPWPQMQVSRMRLLFHMQKVFISLLCT